MRKTNGIILMALAILFTFAGAANGQSISTRDDSRAGIYLGMFPLGTKGEPGTAEFVRYTLRLKLFGNSTRGQGGLIYFKFLDGKRFELNPSLASNFGFDTLQFRVDSEGTQEISLTSEGPLTFGSVTVPTDITHFDTSDPLNSNVLGVAYLEVRNKKGGLLSFVPVAMARPAVKFLADVEFSGEGRTWLAILNPSDKPVKVTLKLGGAFVNSRKGRGDDRPSFQDMIIEIGPGAVTTMYLDEFFEDIATGVFIPARLDIFAGSGVVVNTYHVGKQIIAVPVFPRR